MKLAKTNEKEIDSLMDVLNEIEQINKHMEYDGEYWEEFKNELDSEKESFPICCELASCCKSKDQFYRLVFNHLSGIHFQRILWNCSTMLENCADPNSDHLDFKPEIKAGLELLKNQPATT